MPRNRVGRDTSGGGERGPGVFSADDGREATSLSPTSQDKPIRVGVVDSSHDQVRVALEVSKGRQVLDLRIYSAFTMANVFMPTKLGLSIAVETLPGLIALLQQATRQAEAIGWLREAPADTDPPRKAAA
jgi:hypothetical protein